MKISTINLILFAINILLLVTVGGEGSPWFIFAACTSLLGVVISSYGESRE